MSIRGETVERRREQLKNDVESLTEELRISWDAYCATIAHPIQHNSNTGDSFVRIATEIFHAVRTWKGDEMRTMSVEDGSRLYDAGLPDLIQDIITADHFFSSSWVRHLRLPWLTVGAEVFCTNSVLPLPVFSIFIYVWFTQMMNGLSYSVFVCCNARTPSG